MWSFSSLRLYYKKSKSYLLINRLNLIKFVFIAYPHWGLKYIKLRCWSLAFTLCIAFLINKKRSGISLPTWFSASFLKTFYHAIFYQLNFIAWLPLLFEILDNIWIVIICCPVCDAINFEINHNFLIKPFLHITKNLGQKCNICNI